MQHIVKQVLNVYTFTSVDRVHFWERKRAKARTVQNNLAVYMELFAGRY